MSQSNAPRPAPPSLGSGSVAIPPPPRLLVSVEEAGDLLGIGRTGMFDLLREGRVRGVRIGRRRLIPVSELVTFVDSLMASVV